MTASHRFFALSALPLLLASSATAWVTSPLFAWTMRSQSSTTTATQLQYLNDGGKSSGHHSQSDADLIRQAQTQKALHTPQKKNSLTPSPPHSRSSSCRASIEGVSLAPRGFYAMLRIGHDAYVPWQITDDPADATSATSPEALTMIQLLSGVDMAGAILPPDVLARLIVLECERRVMVVDKDVAQDSNTNNKEWQVVQTILQDVQASLPNGTVSYAQAHEWVQSRAKLPEASLDEVVVTRTADSAKEEEDRFSWTCQIRHVGSLTFEPQPDLLEAVLYQYSAHTSRAFCSLALGLRYQAPITVVMMDTDHDRGSSRMDTENASLDEVNDENDTQPPDSSPRVVFSLKSLQEAFPLYATKHSLQQTSNRVQENIVTSFEIHKLTGALKIAMKLGDTVAAAKIRKALDEYDSMDDLPTVGGSNSGMSEEGGIVVDENHGEGGLDALQ